MLMTTRESLRTATKTQLNHKQINKKNLPANARDMGSISGHGTGSHMLQGSSACAPQLLCPPTLKPVLSKKRSPCNEKPVHHSWRGALAHHNLRKP